MQIEPQRLKEMYEKFAELGNVMEERSVGGGALELRTMKLEISLPDALIGLGVTKNEEEGKYFLSALVASSVVALASGETTATEMLQDLVKLGFYIGTVNGKKEREN